MHYPDSPRCRSPEHLSSPNRVSRLISIKAHNSLSASLCNQLQVIGIQNNTASNKQRRLPKKRLVNYLQPTLVHIDAIPKNPSTASDPKGKKNYQEQKRTSKLTKTRPHRRHRRHIQKKTSKIPQPNTVPKKDQ